MTAAELLAMPSDDLRHELVKGELLTMAPAGFEHGSLGLGLAARMKMHAIERDLGDILNSDTGFYLSRNPDTVRAPDVAFVKKSRVPSPKPKGFFEGAPDLAVEVISPGDTLQEVEDKVGDYLDAGAHSVWTLNPRRRTVTAYSHDGTFKILHENDSLDGGDVFPGFSVRVGDLFT